MQLVQLYIPIDAAHDTIDELGKTGLVQFRDVSGVQDSTDGTSSGEC